MALLIAKSMTVPGGFRANTPTITNMEHVASKPTAIPSASAPTCVITVVLVVAVEVTSGFWRLRKTDAVIGTHSGVVCLGTYCFAFGFRVQSVIS